MIAEKIDSIVAVRKAKLEGVKLAKASVSQVFEAVKKIEAIQGKLNGAEENDFLIEMLKKQPEVCANISRIDINNFYRVYEKYLDELNKLENRFSRATLNISFVGAAGQGKSCVLQKISGLSGEVIPSATGTDCTGAKSIISNVSDCDEVEAEITFYSADEIIDIVNAYLVEISGSSDYKVYSLEQISVIPIAKIEEQVRFDANAQGKLTQLRKYVEHLSEVKHNIGLKKLVCKDEIEKYVAQHSCTDEAVPYYDYLCVKCADIRCSFLKKDAGRIILVDTKGLGDTSMKVEENMLYAAENDSDAIVLMYRPDPLRAGLRQQEIDILQKIGHKITPEYCKELLYWVVNRVEVGDGKNLHVIKSAVEEIRKKNMPVADVLEVNCGDDKDVRENLLEPVLSGLTERIEHVDKLIINRFNDTANELIAEFRKIASRLDGVFSNCASEDVKRTMNGDVQRTRDGMLDALREIPKELEKCGINSCKQFEDAGNAKLKKLLKYVPSQEQVVALLKKGTAIHIDVYEECTHIIRMSIIDDFLELDETLRQIVNQLKKRIIGVLTTQGKLGLLVSYDGKDPDAWFEAFLRKIDAEGNKYPLISKAIKEIERFSISVEGFLIYEVRATLEELDPSLHAQTPQIKAGGADKEEQAEDIIFWLRQYVSKVYDELRKALVEFYKVPNKALFAAAKDFYDRATFSQKNTYDTVQEQWRYLYEEWLPVIWEKEYAININGVEAYKEWSLLVKSIQENACSDALIIK